MATASDRTRDAEEVLFLTRAPVQGGMETAPQIGVVTRTMEEVKEDWKVVSSQVLQMVSSVEKQTLRKGFSLGEITVSLGFSASGKLLFIAEAGIEASVELTFKKSR